MCYRKRIQYALDQSEPSVSIIPPTDSPKVRPEVAILEQIDPGFEDLRVTGQPDTELKLHSEGKCEINFCAAVSGLC